MPGGPAGPGGPVFPTDPVCPGGPAMPGRPGEPGGPAGPGGKINGGTERISLFTLSSARTGCLHASLGIFATKMLIVHYFDKVEVL